jgi:hypothetical protein
MDDWESLRAPLDAVREGPADEERIKKAVDAAELVASAAGDTERPRTRPSGDEWRRTRHRTTMAVRSMKRSRTKTSGGAGTSDALPARRHRGSVSRARHARPVNTAGIL